MFAKTITNQPIPLETTKDGFNRGIPPKTGFEKSVLLFIKCTFDLKTIYKFVSNRCVGKKAMEKTCDQPKFPVGDFHKAAAP